MHFVYHQVHETLAGDRLMPLNQLKLTFPDLYANYAKKYDWRKHIMQQKIPVLNCLWNDVLHFTPVHPSLIRQELEKVGEKVHPHWRWFEVDVRILQQDQLVIFTDEHPGFSQKDFLHFSISELKKHNQMTEATKKYYRRQKEEGKNILYFVGLPHIMYHGTIPFEKMKIIEI